MAQAKLTAICVSVVVHNILSSTDSLQVCGSERRAGAEGAEGAEGASGRGRKEVLSDPE